MLGLGNLLSRGKVLGFPNQFSFEFDGSNDYLEIADNGGLGFADGQAFSASIWFQTSDATSEMYLFDNRSGGGTTEGFSALLDGNATNYLGYIADGSSSATVTNTTDYHDGNWHHFAFTWDGTDTITSYIDGSSVGTATQALGEVDGGALYIGKYGGGSSSYFNGQLDEFAVWSVALSASDIAKIASKPLNLSLASAYATDRTSNLKLWLRAGDKGQPEKNPSITRSDYYTDFDGSDDHVVVSDNSALDFSTGDFTVTLWHKSGAEHDQPFINKKTAFADNTAGWTIYMENSNDQMRCRIAGGSSNVAVSAGTKSVSDNNWHFTTMVRSGDNLYLYIDGFLEGSTTGVNSLDVDNSDDLYIGRGGSTYPQISASSASLYQTAIDSQTIKQFAKSRFTPMRDNRFSVVDLDGVNDYIDFGSDINLGTASTLSFWMRGLSDTSDTRYLVGSSSANEFMIRQIGNLKYWVAVMGESGDNDTWDYSYDHSLWNHLVFVRSSSTQWKVYLNGSLQDTLTDSDWSNDDTKIRYIGRNNAGYYFQASIAQCAFYNSALSADDVYAQYAKGITGDYSDDSNLQGYWRMGSGTGDAYPTIKDQSTNSNDGTITNGAYNDIVQQMVAGYDMGAFDNSSLATNVDALDFDGTGDYIDCGDLGTLSSGWTVSIWWANDQATAENSIWRHNSTKNGVSAYNGTSVLFYYASTQTGTNIGSYTQDQWVHTVHTLNSDLVTMNTYSNGVDKDTDTLDTNSVNYTFNSFYIGNGGYGAWDGQIAQVAVYSSELTAEQVLTQYNLGIGGDYSSDSNLVGYWKMNTSSTSSNAITDLSGNGNHGTVNGNPRLLSYYDDGVQLISPLSDTYPAIIDVNEPILGVEQVDDIASWNTVSGVTATITTSTNTVALEADDGNTNTVTAYMSTAGFLNTNIPAGLHKITFTASWTNHPYIKSVKWYYTGAGVRTYTITEGLNTIYEVMETPNVNVQFSIQTNNANQDLTLSNISVKQIQGNPGAMTNQAADDLVYSSVLPDQSFLTGVNSAYNFITLDGSDEHIACGNIINGRTTTTLSAWFNTSNDSNNDIIGEIDSSSTVGLRIVSRASVANAIWLQSGNGGSGAIAVYSDSAAHRDGNWHHVVGTYDGSTLKLYFDGATTPVATASASSLTFNATGFSIGGAYPEYMNGKIGQCAVWGNALSATEVSAIYAIGRHGNLLDKYADNLLGYWAMGALDASTGLKDVGNGTIYDRSGQSNHGTATNTEAADLASSPNADPNGYAKGDTIRDSSSKA